ncbi:MAG: hypothetical protein QNK05_12815 [Myxococcota bacterium]|nr:hypothetical protein [Myxococcota bacterium]
MRSLSRSLVVLALWVCASSASAGTFNLIAKLNVVTISGFDHGYTLTGNASSVTSIGGGIAQLPMGLFTATLTGIVSPPASGVNGFSVVGGGLPAGTLDAAAASNVLPLQGIFKIKAGVVPAGSLPQTPIGAGGSATGMILGVFKATLIAEPWQLGVHTIFGAGLATGTVMVTGFDARTALGAGQIQFVAPQMTVVSAIPITVPSASILTLTYVPVPEPGTGIVVLAAAVICLRAGLRRR